jgi:hypothetical protein
MSSLKLSSTETAIPIDHRSPINTIHLWREGYFPALSSGKLRSWAVSFSGNMLNCTTEIAESEAFSSQQGTTSTNSATDSSPKKVNGSRFSVG